MKEDYTELLIELLMIEIQITKEANTKRGITKRSLKSEKQVFDKLDKSSLSKNININKIKETLNK